MNQNKVELIGYYGGDNTHALSAWTSTYRELTDKKIERIPALLQMLADHSHGTPFEKSLLHFLVDTDIATHIHILKHRVGVSVNAESAIYKELKEDKMYLPADWGIKTSKETKLITSQFNLIQHGDWQDLLEYYASVGNVLYHRALEDLTPLLGRKRAKESARFFKTYNSQITSDISFNFRSFAHFQILRNSEHAQKEVRELAQTMLDLVKNIKGNPFEKTLAAFGF